MSGGHLWIPSAGAGRGEVERLVREAIDRSELAVRVKRLESEIIGEVSVSGAAISGVRGTGYTVTRTSAGAFTVTFNEAFRVPPVVVCGVIASAPFHVRTGNPTTTLVAVRTENAAGALADPVAFSFLARGIQG